MLHLTNPAFKTKFFPVILTLIITLAAFGCGGDGGTEAAEEGGSSSTNLPTAPSDLQANAATSTQINLAWQDNSDNENGFKIERKVSDGSYTEVGAVGIDSISFSDTLLTPDTTYFYRVRAYNDDGNSGYCTEVSTATSTAPPDAPTGLSAAASSPSQIDLTWTDNSDNEQGFRIERSPDGITFSQIDTVSADSAAYSDTELASYTTYYYQIRAYNASGDSSYTSIDSATTDDVIPEIPGDLSLTVMSSGQIDLEWTDNSDNELGFEIARSLNGSTFTIVDTVSADETTYSDTTLAPDTTYYFRVRAYNLVGDSAYSGSVSDTTNDVAPDAPTDLLLDVSYTTINLEWTDNSDNETGFSIERSLDGSSFSVVDTNSASDTTYSDTGLSPDTTFYYRVRAYNSAGESSYTSVENDTTTETLPDSPTGLLAASAGPNAIDLSWTDNSDNEQGFRIERSGDGTNFSELTTVAAGAESYQDTGLDSETTYYYRVCAYNSGGDSGFSGDSATTDAASGLTNISDISTISGSELCNFTAGDNSNGLYSIWKVTVDVDEYFDGPDSEGTENFDSYMLFSETKSYYIIRFSDSGNYYLRASDNGASYTFNSSTEEITMDNVSNPFIDITGSTAYLGYFVPTDKFDFHLLSLEKASSFSGTIQTVTDDGLDLMYMANEWPKGDGESANGINITVNYSGSKDVSGTSPIIVGVLDDGDDDVAGGALFSSSGTINITGIPDGDYKVLAYLKESYSSDNEDLVEGDSHILYSGIYFVTSSTLSGSPTAINLSGGETESITVDFDDSYPYPSSAASSLTTLNSVSASFNDSSNELTVTIDMDTTGYGTGVIGNLGMEATFYAPSSYMVNGIENAEKTYERGQYLRVNLSHSSGTTWTGTRTVSDYYESGTWKLGQMQVWDNVDDSMVWYNSERYGKFMTNYHIVENYDYDGMFPSDVAVISVDISTDNPIVERPVLTGISVDNAVIADSDTATVTLTMTANATTGVITDVGRNVGEIRLLAEGETDYWNTKRYTIYCQADGSFKATIDGSDLSLGSYDVLTIMIRDDISNSANYRLFNDSVYTGNPFGISESEYYQYETAAEYPASTGISPITITKTIAGPEFSLTDGDWFTGEQSLTLTSATGDTTIYYTTDGSVPTSSDTEYSSAISITDTTTVKAIAVKDGEDSTVSEGTFYIRRIVVGGNINDEWMIKVYDADGNEDTSGWNKTFDSGYAPVGGPPDYVHSIAFDSSANLYVFGNQTNSSGNYDLWIKKYNPDGTVVSTGWEKTYNGAFNGYDWAKEIVVDSNDDIYITAISQVTDNGTSEFINDDDDERAWIIKKYQADGTEITSGWDKALTINRGSYCLAIDSSDNLYVAGGYNTAPASGGTMGWRIKKFQSDGTEITTGWDLSWDLSATGVGPQVSNIVIDTIGNIYFLGIRYSGANRVWGIKKYQSNGTEISTGWDKLIGAGNGDDTIEAAALDSNNNLYVVGETINSSIETDGLIKKYQSDGTEITTGWNKTFDDGYDGDVVRAIAIDSNGNVYTGAQIAEESDGEHYELKKFQSDGIEVISGWDKEYPTSGGGIKVIKIFP